MLWIKTALDGKVTTIDVVEHEAPPVDEIAALRAEIDTLRKAAVAIAQQPAPITKAQAEALVKPATVKQR